MNKKYQFLVFIFFLSIGLFSQNKDLNLSVKNEASLKAASFLNLIPVGKEKEYGFNNRDFSKIKIEEPYKIYYLTYKDNKLWFISGNEWRVPISVDGQYSTLLTIQINNGKPEVVDLGGALLARKLQEFKSNITETNQQQVIIRNTFLKKDYIAPQFSSLYFENTNPDLFEINTNAAQFVYQINEQLPIKTSIALFCTQTVDFINNENK